MTETPTPTPSETTSETPSASPTASPTASSSATPEPSEEPASATTTGTPSWVWWLLGALLVAAAVAIPLLVRASKHRRWRADLAEAEGEVGWFAQTLLPGLQQAGSPAEVRGGWGVGQARVAAVEDRLTALAASAPDEEGEARAVTLRDAVRQARERIAALAASETADVSRELAPVSADLAAALRPPATAGA